MFPYLHKLFDAFVSVFPQEGLEGLHTLCRQQPVPIVVAIIIVVVVVDVVSQREEHLRRLSLTQFIGI